MKWTFDTSMVGNWIFCLTILLHKCCENRAITNRNNGQTHEGSVRQFRHIAGIPSNSPSNWEVGLREAAIQALLRENGCCLHPQLRALINSAPFIGRRDTTTPFGDVVVLSRGQLYQVGGAYVFVQDPWENDCDECHNARRQCGPGGWCEVWKPRNHERLVALWTVKRLRHRNPDHTHRYELEFTVSPINAEMEAYITRNGRFDYFIPGHVFVIKKEESRSKQIAEEEIYNRKIPHVHYKPDIIVGIDHQGQKHILHSYPGFFTSQPIHPTKNEYYPDQDRKEIDLYRKLIDSLAAKTTGTTGGDKVGTILTSKQYVPTQLTTTKKTTVHTPAMTKPSKTMIHYFMPMGEVLLTTEPVTTKATPPMTTDGLNFLFPEIQTTATTTIKPTLTTVDTGDVFYNTVEKPTVSSKPPSTFSVIKSTEPMRTTTTTMSMHETDILYPEIEKTTIRTTLSSPTTTSNEMLKPYDTTITTTNTFFEKTPSTKTREYTYKSTEPSGSTVIPRVTIETTHHNISAEPATAYPYKTTEPSGNTLVRMETTYHKIPIEPSHVPEVNMETTHNKIPTKPKTRPRTTEPSVNTMAKTETTYHKITTEPNYVPVIKMETTHYKIPTKPNTIFKTRSKTTEPSGSTGAEIEPTYHKTPTEPSQVPGVKMESTHHKIPTRLRPKTTYSYKPTEPSASTMVHNIPIEPSHTPMAKMETTHHNIPIESNQIPKTKPETIYPFKSTEPSDSTVPKMVLSHTQVVKMETTHQNIPTEPNTERANQTTEPSGSTMTNTHTPEAKTESSHHISIPKVETTYTYKSTEVVKTTNQYKPTEFTRIYDNKNDTTSQYQPTRTSTISIDYKPNTSTGIPFDMIETTKEYMQTNETGISVDNIHTKYPKVEKTTARTKYTKKYQKTLPSKHKTTTRDSSIYSTRKYYTTKKTRYSIPSTKLKKESPTPISTSTGTIQETFTTSKIPIKTIVGEDKLTKPKETTFGTSTDELTTTAAPIQSVVTRPLKESIQTSSITGEISTMDSLSKITTTSSTAKETPTKHPTTEPTDHNSTTATLTLNVTTPEIILITTETISGTLSTMPMKFTNSQQEAITNQVPEPHTDNNTTLHFDSTTPITTIYERNTSSKITSTNTTTERMKETTTLEETLATDFRETTVEANTVSSSKPIQTSTKTTTETISTEMNTITPTRTTTVTNFLTEDVAVHEPILTKPIHKDYDEDDIFGTTLIKQRPTETTATKLTESDLAVELFDKNAKIIFSNFYEASTSPVQTSTHQKEINDQPLTSQSYETSISYKINKRNRSKMKTTTVLPSPAPSVRANVIEIMNKGSYRVYKAELPEDTTEGNISNLTFNSSRDMNVSNLEITKINPFKNLESVKANVSAIMLEPGYSVYRAEMPTVEVVTDQNVAAATTIRVTTDSKTDNNPSRTSKVTRIPETHSNIDNNDYVFLNSEMSISNTTENSSKVFDDLALQLVNHARTINYLNNNKTRNKRGKYKRRRTYIPRNRKNYSRKT